MGEINLGRVIGGGIVAGIVYNVGEAILNLVVLAAHVAGPLPHGPHHAGSGLGAGGGGARLDRGGVGLSGIEAERSGLNFVAEGHQPLKSVEGRSEARAAGGRGRWSKDGRAS